MRCRLSATLLAVTSTVIGWVVPASGRETVIVFDHREGRLSVQTDGETATVADGDRVRIAPGSDLTVVVRSTNTALYTYSIAIEEAEAREIEALRAFAPALKGYVPEITARRHQLGLPSEPASSLDVLLADIACAFDTLHQVELLALDALVRMSASDSMRLEVDDFARCVEPYLTGGSPPHLALAGSIANQMRKLNERILDNDAAATESMAQARELIASTRSLLDQVYAVEALVLAVRDARDTWSQHLGKVSASHERSLTLAVRRRSEPIASGFAHWPEREVRVRVEPRWPVRPAVGVALVLSPASEYATYVVDRSASPPVVLRTGSTDARVTYGLSLALTLARFYDEDRGISFWPLDVTLNPADNVRAFGIGSALSWNIVKLSMGFLWTKHEEVQDQGVIETYGHPELYFGLGLAGWLD